jgi:hypothetical protein
MRVLRVVCMLVVYGCARPPAPTTSSTGATPTAATTTTTASSIGAAPSSDSPTHADVVVGVAHDAKGGAILLGDDGTTTRIGGLDAWPPSLLHHRVVAEGHLEMLEGPACASDPVMPCQGIVGSYRALVDAKFRLE